MNFFKDFITNTFILIIISATIIAIIDKNFSENAYKDIMISCISALAGLHTPINSRNTSNNSRNSNKTKETEKKVL